MPVTRSTSSSTRSTRSNAVNSAPPIQPAKSELKSPKKKAPARKASRTNSADNAEPASGDSAPPQAASSVKLQLAQVANMKSHTPPSFIPAVLPFSLSDAKDHLIKADPRFEDIFARLECRPFEKLERVDPFRTLAVSILGQQISWLAARSITHRFIRLFDPSLPEKPIENGTLSSPDAFFPSAEQVTCLDVPTLRTAGLSARKAEYVLDLAARFADGRLTTEKIFKANDEELAEMLIAVRGIGRWTVDMFAIFSLRRPDILPIGDLGVQRGVVRWFLSLHSHEHPITISPKKLPAQPSDDDVKSAKPTNDESMEVDPPADITPNRASTPDISSLPPLPPHTPVTPAKGSSSATQDVDDIEVPDGAPPAFTPSINRTLNKLLPTKYQVPALPDGITVQDLKARLNGKNRKKGAILSPKEMEDLTDGWKPYRSIAVYYMWALAEGDKSG